MIYLDHAATTPVAAEVLDAMLPSPGSARTTPIRAVSTEAE